MFKMSWVQSPAGSRFFGISLLSQKAYLLTEVCNGDVMCFACALLHLESDMSNAVMLWLVLHWSGFR